MFAGIVSSLQFARFAANGSSSTERSSEFCASHAKQKQRKLVLCLSSDISTNNIGNRRQSFLKTPTIWSNIGTRKCEHFKAFQTFCSASFRYKSYSLQTRRTGIAFLPIDRSTRREKETKCTKTYDHVSTNTYVLEKYLVMNITLYAIQIKQTRVNLP